MAVIMTQKRCTLNQHRSATSIKNIMLWIEDKLYIGLQGRRKWGGCKGHYCRMLTEAKYWSFVSHNSPHGPNFCLKKERWFKFEVIISLAIILSLDESLGHAGYYGKSTLFNLFIQSQLTKRCHQQNHRRRYPKDVLKWLLFENIKNPLMSFKSVILTR